MAPTAKKKSSTLTRKIHRNNLQFKILRLQNPSNQFKDLRLRKKTWQTNESETHKKKYQIYRFVTRLCRGIKQLNGFVAINTAKVADFEEVFYHR